MYGVEIGVEEDYKFYGLSGCCENIGYVKKVVGFLYFDKFGLDCDGD